MLLRGCLSYRVAWRLLTAECRLSVRCKILSFFAGLCVLDAHVILLRVLDRQADVHG